MKTYEKLPLKTLVNLNEGDNYRRFRATEDYLLSADYAYFVSYSTYNEETESDENGEFFVIDLEDRAEYPGLVYIKNLPFGTRNERGDLLYNPTRIINFSGVTTVEEAEAIIKEFSDTPEFLSRFTLDTNGVFGN